jgi:hypothetical protein
MGRAPKKPIRNPDERTRANEWAPLALIVATIIVIGLLALVLVIVT